MLKIKFLRVLQTSEGKPLSWWKALAIFLILFYILTFAVYYFYSPGPQERRMAEEGLSGMAGVGVPSETTSSSTAENGN